MDIETESARGPTALNSRLRHNREFISRTKFVLRQEKGFDVSDSEPQELPKRDGHNLFVWFVAKSQIEH